MTDTTTNDLDAITARADAASEGPWETRPSLGRVASLLGRWSVETTEAVDDPRNISYEVNGAADAEFIAHAREDVPALIAEVHELRAERDAYRSDAEAWRRHMALQASVDNATPPRHVTGGPTGEPPRRPRGGSPSYVFTRAQVPRALRPDKTTALAEDREADPTDDCD